MGGKILKTEQWGLRTFAYIINKSKKGHYTLIESECSGAAIIEMERLMRNNEDKGPSAILAKHDNDDNRYDNTQEVA
jgi:small subunit ribosomal protein S6